MNWMKSPYDEFGRKLLARYSEFDNYFEPAPMVFAPSAEEGEPSQQIQQVYQTFVTRIQKLQQENVSIHQNMTMLTEVLEKHYHIRKEMTEPSLTTEKTIQRLVTEQVKERTSELPITLNRYFSEHKEEILPILLQAAKDQGTQGSLTKTELQPVIDAMAGQIRQNHGMTAQAADALAKQVTVLLQETIYKQRNQTAGATHRTGQHLTEQEAQNQKLIEQEIRKQLDANQQAEREQKAHSDQIVQQVVSESIKDTQVLLQQERREREQRQEELRSRESKESKTTTKDSSQTLHGQGSTDQNTTGPDTTGTDRTRSGQINIDTPTKQVNGSGIHTADAAITLQPQEIQQLFQTVVEQTIATLQPDTTRQRRTEGSGAGIGKSRAIYKGILQKNHPDRLLQKKSQTGGSRQQITQLMQTYHLSEAEAREWQGALYYATGTEEEPSANRSVQMPLTTSGDQTGISSAGEAFDHRKDRATRIYQSDQAESDRSQGNRSTSNPADRTDSSRGHQDHSPNKVSIYQTDRYHTKEHQTDLLQNYLRQMDISKVHLHQTEVHKTHLDHLYQTEVHHTDRRNVNQTEVQQKTQTNLHQTELHRTNTTQETLHRIRQNQTEIQKLLLHQTETSQLHRTNILQTDVTKLHRIAEEAATQQLANPTRSQAPRLVRATVEKTIRETYQQQQTHPTMVHPETEAHVVKQVAEQVAQSPLYQEAVHRDRSRTEGAQQFAERIAQKASRVVLDHLPLEQRTDQRDRDRQKIVSSGRAPYPAQVHFQNGTADANLSDRLAPVTRGDQLQLVHPPQQPQKAPDAPKEPEIITQQKIQQEAEPQLQIIKEAKKVIHQEQQIQRQDVPLTPQEEKALERQVSKYVERHLEEKVNRITSVVYRRIEDKLKIEKGRRGLI